MMFSDNKMQHSLHVPPLKRALHQEPLSWPSFLHEYVGSRADAFVPRVSNWAFNGWRMEALIVEATSGPEEKSGGWMENVQVRILWLRCYIVASLGDDSLSPSPVVMLHSFYLISRNSALVTTSHISWSGLKWEMRVVLLHHVVSIVSTATCWHTLHNKLCIKAAKHVRR